MADSGGKGFSALAVRLFDRVTTISYLFVRRHAEIEADVGGGGGGALFVAGLPVVHHPMAVALEAIFSAFGQVKFAVVHQSELSALVLFASEASVEKVLSTAAAGSVVEAPLAEPTEPHGLKGWVHAHKAKFPGTLQLKKQLDAWMEAFEAREAEAKQAGADDDGWTVVARKPGRKNTVDTEAGVAVGGVSKAAAEAYAQRKPVKQLEGFYKHQRQEKKRTELLALRAKFEEDRRKIAEMRANRRFKPY